MTDSNQTFVSPETLQAITDFREFKGWTRVANSLVAPGVKYSGIGGSTSISIETENKSIRDCITAAPIESATSSNKYIHLQGYSWDHLENAPFTYDKTSKMWIRRTLIVAVHIFCNTIAITISGHDSHLACEFPSIPEANAEYERICGELNE